MRSKPKTPTNHKLTAVISPTRRVALFLLFTLVVPAASARFVPLSTAIPDSKNLKPTDPYALIFGTVWGPDDHPVYGVKVRIRRSRDKKPGWEIYSNHVGEFAQRVPAARVDYIVSVDPKSLKTKGIPSLHLAQEVTIHVEYDERVDTSLHLTH